ncbi:MAG: 1-acyl-sn-glycerol-3-phosphate acyltransferase [Planctomycetes bacterium]|nr:1-acyl-sn-glycerol-3-phosphate acyltransferase [Planctomycetota bacterium]
MGKLLSPLFDLIFYFDCAAVWMASCIIWRIRIFGSNNIPKTNYLIVSNHQSFLDPILITDVIKKRPYYILRTTLKGIFFWMITFPFKLIYIKRGEADVGAVRQAIDIINKGEILLMFPEGTRSATGKIGKIKLGFLIVAEKTGKPIVPVLIQGANKCWKKGQLLPSFGKISLTFFKPILVTNNRDAAAAYIEKCWNSQLRDAS